VGDEINVEEGSGSGLVIHAVVFVAVNLLLIAVWGFVTSGASFDTVPDLIGHPSKAREAGFFPIVVMAFWGAALLIHAGVFVAGIPRRRRARRARRRQRRRLQRTVVGALGDTVLADAAIAGIKLVDGEKAAKKVRRDAGRDRARNGKPSKAAKAAKAAKGTKSSSAGRRATSRDDRRSPDAPTTDVAAPVATEDAPTFGRRLADQSASRHWVAVMFTDIVDSTPLNQQYGDEAWAEILAEHRRVVRGCVADCRGREVGTQGDGFLVRFESPDEAAACAIALQRHLLGARAHDDRTVHVRIGIHAGEVVQNDDDLVGRVINLASRVTGAAAPDEILVTEPFADHLTGGHPLVDRGLKTLKGFDQPRHLLALAWNHADEIALDDLQNN
jgi:class 3 adenylate cyclase